LPPRKPKSGEQTPNRLSHDPGVHDFPLDDRVGRDFRRGHLDQLRLVGAVIDHHQLGDTGADIEPHRRFFAAQKAEKRHGRLGVEDRGGEGKLQYAPPLILSSLEPT